MPQVERLVRCAASLYQAELMRIVRHKLEGAAGDSRGGGGRGGAGQVNVTNSVMELRNICNHPYTRWPPTSCARLVKETGLAHLQAGFALGMEVQITICTKLGPVMGRQDTEEDGEQRYTAATAQETQPAPRHDAHLCSFSF